MHFKSFHFILAVSFSSSSSASPTSIMSFFVFLVFIIIFCLFVCCFVSFCFFCGTSFGVGIYLAAPLKIIVVVVAPPAVTIVVVVVVSGCSFIYWPSKNLSINGCRNTLEGANNKLGSCNIFKMDDCLLLETGSLISFIYCEFCDHSLCDSICDFLFAMYSSIPTKKNLKLLHNATTCW